MSIFYIFRHFKIIKMLFNNDNLSRNNSHYLNNYGGVKLLIIINQ